MPRYATLDGGTNTVLLLVAEPDGARFGPVAEQIEITRLGKGVDRSGVLAPEAVEATVAAIVRFAKQARSLGAEGIACVATSAARDAKNGPDFMRRVREEAGVEVEIISGELEAELSYGSQARELGTSAPLAVLDIGGGSTEVVVGHAGKLLFKHSFDLGSVRLTERFARHDPPAPDERQAMADLLDMSFAKVPAPPPGFQLVGVAGTVTTLFAVSQGIEPYDPERVHLARLSLETVRAECERYFSLDLDARRKLRAMPAKRADVIPAGALILERAMIRLGAHEMVVSDRGIRWGLLFHRFGAALRG